MTDHTVRLPDLTRILRESAGTEPDVDLDGEILDTSFEELGYDSLAIMETAATMRREYGVAIDDDALTGALTPRVLLELVNGPDDNR